MKTTLIATMIGALMLNACGERADWADTRVKRTAERVASEASAVKPAVDREKDKSAKLEKAVDAAARKDAPRKVDLEPEVDVNADLYVKRLVIAHGVDEREPVDPAETFEQGDGERIYAFVEIGNRDRTASEVYVSFVKDGARDNGGVRLRVGASPRWRTWAYTRLAKDPGTWHAVVKNAKGEELARQKFEVVTVEPLKAPA